MEIIDGKELAKKIRESVKDEILTKYVSQGKDVPCLVCIIVGENKASIKQLKAVFVLTHKVLIVKK